MLGSFAFAQPDARVAPTMAQSPGPESVRSSTESLHMTLAQHLDVKESDDTELQALLSRVDGDVPDDDIDEDELALLEAQLGQKEEPTGALAALGAERCRQRTAAFVGAGEQDEAPHHGCPTNCRGSMLASWIATLNSGAAHDVVVLARLAPALATWKPTL